MADGEHALVLESVSGSEKPVVGIGSSALA